jgi:hypothetical protein
MPGIERGRLCRITPSVQWCCHFSKPKSVFFSSWIIGHQQLIKRLFLGQVFAVHKGLHGCFPVKVFAAMDALRVVAFDPLIDVSLEFFARAVELAPKRTGTELVQKSDQV